MQTQIPRHKDYLQRTFLEELDHKLWSTKGARFHANKRLLEINDLSASSLSFLSAYLIILGLLSVYQITKQPIISDRSIAFGSTALSILLLVFSQSEAAKDYKVKAHQFHDCALKIAELYNELKIFKTLAAPTIEETIKFCDDISRRYQSVLDKYSNHESIDFLVFKSDNQEYYELNTLSVLKVRFEYYWSVKFRYHVFILLPPLIFILLALKVQWI